MPVHDIEATKGHIRKRVTLEHRLFWEVHSAKDKVTWLLCRHNSRQQQIPRLSNSRGMFCKANYSLRVRRPVLPPIPLFSRSRHYHPRLLYSIKARRLCIWISLNKPLFEISPLKSEDLLSLTANNFNSRWHWASQSSVCWRKKTFPLSSPDKMGGFLNPMSRCGATLLMSL